MSKAQPTRRFHFHPVASIAALIALAILLTLGTWQMQRRAWKLDLIAAVEARASGEAMALADALKARADGDDMRYARVALTGRYDPAREFHVFGTLEGDPGYYVFTPFMPEDGGDAIIVNRGFVPQALKDPAKRAQGVISAPVAITALFRQAEVKTGLTRTLAPIDQPSDNIYYARNPALFLDAIDAPAKDWYLDSLGTENSAPFPQGGSTRIEFNNRHMEYALTWYGLALTLVGVYGAYSFRRRG